MSESLFISVDKSTNPSLYLPDYIQSEKDRPLSTSQKHPLHLATNDAA
jgi:hypothetical protein